jgi:hypothetical protein
MEVRLHIHTVYQIEAILRAIRRGVNPSFRDSLLQSEIFWWLCRFAGGGPRLALAERVGHEPVVPAHDHLPPRAADAHRDTLVGHRLHRVGVPGLSPACRTERGQSFTQCRHSCLHVALETYACNAPRALLCFLTGCLSCAIAAGRAWGVWEHHSLRAAQVGPPRRHGRHRPLPAGMHTSPYSHCPFRL